jgi:hypothetical protein
MTIDLSNSAELDSNNDSGTETDDETLKPVFLWQSWDKEAVRAFYQEWYDDLMTTDAPQTQQTLWRQTPFAGDMSYVAEPIGYCCIGRACVVLAKRGLGYWDERVADRGISHFRFERHSIVTSNFIKEFTTTIEMSNFFNDQLIRFNDTHKLSFKHIAKELRYYAMSIGHYLNIHENETKP